MAALYKAGVQDKISHISTGGGASLEYDDGVPGSGKIPGILKQQGAKLALLPNFHGVNPFENAYMTDSSFEGSNKYFGACFSDPVTPTSTAAGSPESPQA